MQEKPSANTGKGLDYHEDFYCTIKKFRSMQHRVQPLSEGMAALKYFYQAAENENDQKNFE
jgi:hypothetical protein